MALVIDEYGGRRRAGDDRGPDRDGDRRDRGRARRGRGQALGAGKAWRLSGAGPRPAGGARDGDRAAPARPTRTTKRSTRWAVWSSCGPAGCRRAARSSRTNRRRVRGGRRRPAPDQAAAGTPARCRGRAGFRRAAARCGERLIMRLALARPRAGRARLSAWAPSMAAGQAPLGFWWMTLAGARGADGAGGAGARCAGCGLARLVRWSGIFRAGAAAGSSSRFLSTRTRYGWMAPFALVFMAFGLGAVLGGCRDARGAAGSPASGARFRASLALAELARGHVLTGFPWALIGHVWIDTPGCAGCGRVSGRRALTLADRACRCPAGRRWDGAVSAAAAVLLAVLAGFGLWRLGQSDPADRAVQLRLVQPNAEQTLKWDPDDGRGPIFDRLLQFTAPPGSGRRRSGDLARNGRALSAGAQPRADGDRGRGRAGRDGDPGVQREEGPRFFNSLVSMAPEGRSRRAMTSTTLCRLANTSPSAISPMSLFGVSAFAAQAGQRLFAGPGAAIAGSWTAFGRVLPLICYEAVFPQDLRNAPGRADWMLQITNDAWFGTPVGPLSASRAGPAAGDRAGPAADARGQHRRLRRSSTPGAGCARPSPLGRGGISRRGAAGCLAADGSMPVSANFRCWRCLRALAAVAASGRQASSAA